MDSIPSRSSNDGSTARQDRLRAKAVQSLRPMLQAIEKYHSKFTVIKPDEDEDDVGCWSKMRAKVKSEVEWIGGDYIVDVLEQALHALCQRQVLALILPGQQ